MTAVNMRTDLTVDSVAPDPLTVFQVDADLIAELSDDAIAVEFAALGVPGRDGADGAAAPIEAVASADLAAGLPVAIDRSTGQFVLADAAWKPAAFVAGLLSEDAIAGFIASAALDRLTLADWSAVTGTAQLVPGVPYFLSAGGGLTSTPPASDCVVMVGKALNAATLLIDPQPPIQR